MLSEDKQCAARVSNGQTAAQDEFAAGYFPANFADPVPVCGGNEYPRIGEVEEEWYPAQLAAACEPSLHKVSQSVIGQGDFMLRLSLMPSFAPSTFVTVEKASGDYTLTIRQMSGAGGYDPGEILRSKRVKLTRDEGEEIERLAARAFITDLRERQEAAADGEQMCFGMFDGTTWLIEQADSSGYRLIEQVSPSRGTSFDLGMRMVELSGWSQQPPLWLLIMEEIGRERENPAARVHDGALNQPNDGRP